MTRWATGPVDPRRAMYDDPTDGYMRRPVRTRIRMRRISAMRDRYAQFVRFTPPDTDTLRRAPRARCQFLSTLYGMVPPDMRCAWLWAVVVCRMRYDAIVSVGTPPRIARPPRHAGAPPQFMHQQRYACTRDGDVGYASRHRIGLAVHHAFALRNGADTDGRYRRSLFGYACMRRAATACDSSIACQLASGLAARARARHAQFRDCRFAQDHAAHMLTASC